MNLLSNANNIDTKRQEEILAVLKELGVSNEELKIAEKFFDFSSDLDISLLENIQYREISDNDVIFRKSSLVFRHMENDDYKYSDRYILFLDAIAANHSAKIFAYNYFDYGYNFRNDRTFPERIDHAYRQRYDEKTVQMKIAALLAQELLLSSNDSKKMLSFAKNDPDILFGAGKYFCKGEYTNAKVQLYAMALAYTKPKSKGSLKTITECISKLKNKETEEMTEYIFQTVSDADFADSEIFEFAMTVLFMTVNHDSRIETLIKEKVQGKEKDFLTVILVNAPNSYFEKNVDKAFEIIDIERSEELIFECIKTALSYSWRKESKNKHKAEIFLNLAAEKYPGPFINAMNLIEKFSINNISNYYYNHYMYYSNDKFYCCFYEEMYKILKKRNPKALSEYNVDFHSDILRLSILTEQAGAIIAKDEIGKYLIGESDFCIFQPYLSDFRNEISVGNKKLVDTCIRLFPDFKRRYFTLKSVQRRLVVFDYIRSNYHNKESDKYKFVAEIISYLNEEKVPIDLRFAFYDDLYNNYCVSEKNTEETILKAMVKLSKKNDEEYQNYCPSGGVFTRRIYTLYLDALNDKNNSNKDKILAMCSDSSKEVRKTVTEVVSRHKEYESEVIELLKAKKLAVREAAVDIFAIWGAGKYQDILIDAANTEKSAKLADKIRKLLSLPNNAEENDESGETGFSPFIFVDNIHKGGRNKKLLWLYETQNPVVHFTNGEEANDKYMQAIMLCYASATALGISENANLLAKELNRDELNKFAEEIFSKWLSDGAETKKKWVLYFAAIHGGYAMIDVILHCIKEWAENMRGAIAAEAVKALSMNGSSEALMAVDNLAHKFKQKQVKKAAVQALDSAAEELGITSDELGDRIVPDLGFNENMERIFDYGTRKFKVYLTPSLELEVYDENEKKLKTVPAPSKKDNAETAKQSNTEFKQMKKQLKNVISIQKIRLETAFLADRRWDREAWEKLFVKNPVMHSFAIGLIWAAYENDKLTETFRYMEDGSFNTSDEDEYELPENCTIGLVHPIDLDEDTLSTWKEQLSDYEIVQPIEQLERKVYHINDDEIGTLDLNRFKGRKINGMSLLGRATKFGWDKGSVIDGGCFCSFHREDIVKRIKNADGTVKFLGNAVELRFDGMYVGGEDIEVTIDSVRFYTPGTISYGSYVYDKADNNKAIKLDKINPRYFSEIINQLEAITKTAEKS